MIDLHGRDDSSWLNKQVAAKRICQDLSFFLKDSEHKAAASRYMQKIAIYLQGAMKPKTLILKLHLIV